MTRLGWLVAGSVLVVMIGAAWVFQDVLPGASPAGSGDPHAGHGHDGVAHWTCPMHPSVKASEPGACPICGMDLQPVPKAQSSGAVSAGAGQALPGFIKLSPWQQQLIGVTTAPVEQKTLGGTVRTIGRVGYDETRLADVNLKISGWIRDLHADYTGKPVKKGQPLFTIYSPELVSTQEEYLLALRAVKDLESGGREGKPVVVETTAEAAGNPGQRPPVAAESTGDLPRREAIRRTRGLLEASRRRLLLWDLTEDQIRELGASGKPRTAMTVYAPASGIVLDKMAVEGMYVKPGMRLYRIAELDTVWITADVYEYELPFVAEGQTAKVAMSYLPDQAFEGKVEYVYPYLDPKTRTAKVRLKVPNPGFRVLPDMYAEVTLQTDPVTRVAIPESAVLFSGTRRIVFVALGEGRFQPREVRLGARMGEAYAVLSGLEEGERVVTAANFLLDSESRLKNVTAGMESTGRVTGEKP